MRGETTKVSRTASEVGPYDILCGRCKQAFNNVGNRRFRVTIGLYLEEYLKATTKKEKGDLILSIVRYLRGHIGARFLKPVKGAKGEYVELGEQGAREKVGHALRDLAVTKNHLTMSEWKSEQIKRKQHSQEKIAQRKKTLSSQQDRQKNKTKDKTKAAVPSPPRQPKKTITIADAKRSEVEEEFFHQTLHLFLNVYDARVRRDEAKPDGVLSRHPMPSAVTSERR